MASNVALTYTPGETASATDKISAPSPASAVAEHNETYSTDNSKAPTRKNEAAGPETSKADNLAGDDGSESSQSSQSTESTLSASPEREPSAAIDREGLVITRRVKNLPVSQCIAGVYGTAMDNVVVSAAVSAAQLFAVLAASPCLLMYGPFRKLCDIPIRSADWLLCKGLDAAETVFPCVAMPPAQVLAATKSCATNCVCCIPRSVKIVTSKVFSCGTQN